MSTEPEWRIYYGDGSMYAGSTADDWAAAPDEDVQVVILMAPYPDRDGHPFRPWRGVDGKQVWTGDDVYDPFGYGTPKTGRWMNDGDYHNLYERAIGDD